MTIADKVLQFMQRQPLASSALLGAGIGAPAGALFSDVGEEGRGALQGGLLGATLGGIGGGASHSLVSALPTPEKALTISALGGGVLGGAMGRRHLSPWMMEHLKSLQGQKEASVTEQEKQAAAKTTAEKMEAFEVGMRDSVADAGLTMEKVAAVASSPERGFGVPISAEKLPEATLTWATSQK